MWFTESFVGAIGRINPTTGDIKEFPVGGTNPAKPQGICAGPDGNLWFTDPVNDVIGSTTPLGAVTLFPTATTVGPPNTSPQARTAISGLRKRVLRAPSGASWA